MSASQDPTSSTSTPAIAAPTTATANNSTTVPEIEADDDEDWADSAYEEGGENSTASITSSILRYREENGRTYHAYQDGKYLLPNDERENERLDLQHALFGLTLGNKLFGAPIPKEQVLHRVLDVGTGTGIWALDFADTHPESHVIGVHLSPIQPKFVSPNVSFEIDEMEATWTFTKPFDFIFERMTLCGMAGPTKYFEQAYTHLVPGGWVECLDICTPVKSDDGSLPEGSALLRWSELMHEGYQTIGRSGRSPSLFREQMEAAGFVNVQEVVYKWPTNRWPKEEKFKELGMWALANVDPGLEGLSLAIFTRMLGWSPEEVAAFLVEVRKELKSPKVHAYWQIYNVYGQKPGDASVLEPN